ncbi:hypothetical protein BaRGS_00037987 [Batillaria attramentaria]|uniref:Uncharacterized protein n=1 Tax=Batillaria attramentaria TaxID=370345 RepID=A0ABD0J764_9CAEN
MWVLGWVSRCRHTSSYPCMSVGQTNGFWVEQEESTVFSQAFPQSLDIFSLVVAALFSSRNSRTAYCATISFDSAFMPSIVSSQHYFLSLLIMQGNFCAAEIVDRGDQTTNH